MGERQTVQLIHVLDVLGALGEGDDITACGLDAVALLDRAERSEGVEHLVGHRLQLATLTVQAMLADVLQSAGMHDGMLTELHLDHVETEGLGLPDEVLQRAVGGTLGVGFGEGALHGLQIGDVVLAGVVHEVGVAVDGGLQTVCHDQHDGAVQLLGGDQRGLVGQTLAHFLLVVPQGLELGARRGGLGLHRQVLADAAGFDLQRAQHMVAELAGHLTAHLGGDVRVAVTVGTDSSFPDGRTPGTPAARGRPCLRGPSRRNDGRPAEWCRTACCRRYQEWCRLPQPESASSARSGRCGTARRSR